MARAALSHPKITTKNPQQALAGAGRAAPARERARRAAGGSARVNGDAREATRGDGRVVVEVVGGITVYPARGAGDRWRATWYENGQRRQCQAVTEDRLAVKLEKVSERLAADAPGMERPGTDLLAFYLSPGRHPASTPWSPPPPPPPHDRSAIRVLRTQSRRFPSGTSDAHRPADVAW